MKYLAHYTYRVAAGAKSRRSFLRASEHTPNNKANATRYETIRQASDALADIYKDMHKYGVIITASGIIEIAD